jgi:transcriptional regulator with XRE-family HTH domain
MQPVTSGSNTMTARPTRRVPPVAGRHQIEKLELQNFARRLHELRVQKGMTQSDLAREIWGETTDVRGNVVARNRDRISQYEKGQSFPDPHNLEKLAKALGITADELAPDITAAAIDREDPAVQLTAIAGHPNQVYLKVNTLTSIRIASQIIALLTDELEANSR